MKYIRRIVFFILFLLFVVAGVICFGIVYSVRNVNITYERYSENADREYSIVTYALNNYKGKSILSVGESEVKNLVNGDSEEDSLLRLVSFKKVMPCTLNIVIKERIETFAVQNGDRFTVYDNDGVVLNAKATQNVNGADGCPNVLFTGDIPDSAQMAAVCNQFYNSFGSLRSVLQSVAVVSSDISDNNTITFQFYSGLTATLLDWQTDTKDKIELVAQRYSKLSDTQKLAGSIRCQEVLGSGDAYTAVYISA